MLPFHVDLIQHGRRTCHARNPECERCPLLALLPPASGSARGLSRGDPGGLSTSRIAAYTQSPDGSHA